MSAETGSSRAAKPAAGRIGAGRPGKVRRAVLDSIAEARAAGRMTAEHEIRAALAERYAAVVDRATNGGDASKLLQAGGRLVDLLDTLPIRAEGRPDRDSSGSGDDRAPVVSLFEAGPTMGDGSHT